MDQLSAQTLPNQFSLTQSVTSYLTTNTQIKSLLLNFRPCPINYGFTCGCDRCKIEANWDGEENNQKGKKGDDMYLDIDIIHACLCPVLVFL